MFQELALFIKKHFGIAGAKELIKELKKVLKENNNYGFLKKAKQQTKKTRAGTAKRAGK